MKYSFNAKVWFKGAEHVNCSFNEKIWSSFSIENKGNREKDDPSCPWVLWISIKI